MTSDMTGEATRPSGASGPPPTAPPPVLVTDAAAVRTVTLNRPGSFNSFDLAMKSALLDALAETSADPAVRAVVIIGSGRAFCAGQDLKEHLALVAARDPRVATTVAEFYNVLVTLLTEMPKPVIAAVNGPAAGAGAGLAYACDLRLAGRSASFSLAFAGVALSADTGASFTLPRLVGYGRASKMMLLGEKVDVDEALRIGMVDEVMPDEELAGRAATLAARMVEGPTRAYRWIKASLRHAAGSDLASTLAFEDRAQVDCFASPDHHEAIQAFVDKRPARFTGR